MQTVQRILYIFISKSSTYVEKIAMRLWYLKRVSCFRKLKRNKNVEIINNSIFNGFVHDILGFYGSDNSNAFCNEVGDDGDVV